MNAPWIDRAIFYHVYPLGMCGAPERNDFAGPPVHRLAQLFDWIPHWQALGITALYLGPLFESSGHGYDTADYYHVDRRLGDHAILKDLVAALHRAGIRVILDGVFNHVGRHFWAFRDLQLHGRHSAYRDWFSGVTFTHRSPMGDPFTYDAWRGSYDLVKLNLKHKPVKEHLLQAVAGWIRDYDIDGLRLDTANIVKAGFIRALYTQCRKQKPDFWMMGEVVTGNYARHVMPGKLDSVTNYNAYAELVTSHNKRNYAALARTLAWQFGPDGVYQGMRLYSFADNHDVKRIGSHLKQPAHLYPLHVLLFTMPGVPSIYYGSEWGIKGAHSRGSDAALRPYIPQPNPKRTPHPALAETIAKLARIRQDSPALRHGTYRERYVLPEQFVFSRQSREQGVVVAVNASAHAASLTVAVPEFDGRRLYDVLNPGYEVEVAWGKIQFDMPPRWGRILVTR